MVDTVNYLLPLLQYMRNSIRMLILIRIQITGNSDKHLLVVTMLLERIFWLLAEECCNKTVCCGERQVSFQ
jgi:hypothetical protein